MRAVCKLASFATLVCAAPAASAATHTLVTCTGDLLGAPGYSVEVVDADGGSPARYRLVKRPNNPAFGPYTVDVPYERALRYGDAFILTLDRGRSGYAHLYTRGEVTVIDVNLFEQTDINSNGPKTNYTCEFSENQP